MTYLGQGHAGSGLRSTQDDLKVLQQVNGGENICVFKGLVTPGDQFQFVSQRHRGFPFSASMYVNGIMAARISSCCEYRYAPGFQQGKKSCFRLAWLSGGVPCYRCTSLRSKYSSCQQLNNGTKENLILPLEKTPGNGIAESCPSSSPLFIPAKLEKRTVRKKIRKHIKEGGSQSTDSEDTAAADKEALTKQNGEKQKEQGSNGKNRDGERLKDFYEECVEMSAALEQSPNKHNWFKANILERCRLQKKLSLCPKAMSSNVELSAESDNALQPDGEPEEEDAASQETGKDEPVKEQDLQAQLDAMMTVLNTSDEVEQLVLRNTDLTDDLLLSLAGALKSSLSEVTMLNLNLNLIGPYGAHILLDVLRVKPQVKGLQ
ncbi:hypothetical protein LDENG_00221690 [Lucifuga dentata]|nr:hypothetical protein LDENG_00221690 [Lucifuga dentata]